MEGLYLVFFYKFEAVIFLIKTIISHVRKNIRRKDFEG